jgi:hypothetical protein
MRDEYKKIRRDDAEEYDAEEYDDDELGFFPEIYSELDQLHNLINTTNKNFENIIRDHFDAASDDVKKEAEKPVATSRQIINKKIRELHESAIICRSYSNLLKSILGNGLKK